MVMAREPSRSMFIVYLALNMTKMSTGKTGCCSVESRWVNSMALCTCSVCRQPFDSEKSAAMPFCSQRCRMIALGRWLEEGYSMPVERARELEAFKDPAKEGED